MKTRLSKRQVQTIQNLLETNMNTELYDPFDILDEAISQLIIGEKSTNITFYNSFEVQEEFESIENQSTFKFILGEEYDRISSELYNIFTQVRRDEKLKSLGI